MKTCTYCGAQNPDEPANCQECGTAFVPSVKPPLAVPVVREEMSPREQSFWKRVTLRQLAIFFVRLQAVWLLLSAVDLALYLPERIIDIHYSPHGTPGYGYARFTMFLACLRVLLYLGAALAVMQYAERLVNWLVKDWVSQTPPPMPPEQKVPALDDLSRP